MLPPMIEWPPKKKLYKDGSVPKLIMYQNKERVLWTEPMCFKRLFAVGDPVVEAGKYYIVENVAVIDGVQHVHLKG